MWFVEYINLIMSDDEEDIKKVKDGHNTRDCENASIVHNVNHLKTQENNSNRLTGLITDHKKLS